MSTWTIVQFINDNSIEAVPTNWLEGKHCYWPQYEHSKIIKAIRNCEPSLPSWEKHAISTFRNATYADYSVARKKCQKAEETSDLNSEIEKGRRIVRSKWQSEIDSSRDSSDSEYENNTAQLMKLSKGLTLKSRPPKISAIPQCPVINITKGAIDKRYRSDREASDDLTVFKATGTAEMINQEQKDAEMNYQVEDLNDSAPCTEKYAEMTSSQIGDLNGSVKIATCEQNHKKHEEYLRQILRKLTILEINMNDLKRDINQIKEKQIQINTGGNELENNISNFYIWDSFDLPHNNEDQILSFEEFLGNMENMQKSVTELAKVGGDSIDEFIKRSFKKLMSNECQMIYSWLGKKQKKSFSALNTAKLLRDAAWKNFKSKPCSEKEIEASISKYIKRAKERADNENKRK